MKTNKLFLIAVFALVSMTAFVGCRRKQDTIAKIYVKDASNQSVANARVVLYGQSTTGQPSSVVLFDTTLTNSSGEAIFNFDDVYQLGQAGVAVLNIDVQSGTMIGQGIIKVVEETTSEETVFIQ